MLLVNLVEPEVLVGLVGDEVASPAMGELVGNHLGPGGVPLDDGGREEDHHGILHAAVREAWRKHEKIKAAPLIWPKKCLPGTNHLLGACELSGSSVEQRCPALGVDTGAEANVAGRNVPSGKGEEVGRDGAIHDELLYGTAGGAPQGIGAGGASLTGDGITGGGSAGGGHDGGERVRKVEACGEDEACGGGVLAGEEGTGVDGLALGVDKRVSFGGGLGRG